MPSRERAWKIWMSWVTVDVGRMGVGWLACCVAAARWRKIRYYHFRNKWYVVVYFTLEISFIFVSCRLVLGDPSNSSPTIQITSLRGVSLFDKRHVFIIQLNEHTPTY